MASAETRRYNREHSGEFVLKLLVRFPGTDTPAARMLAQFLRRLVAVKVGSSGFGATVEATLRRHGDPTGRNLLGPEDRLERVDADDDDDGGPVEPAQVVGFRELPPRGE